MFAGTLCSARSESVTVTVNVAVTGLLESSASVAVQVTVVVADRERRPRRGQTTHRRRLATLISRRRGTYSFTTAPLAPVATVVMFAGT